GAVRSCAAGTSVRPRAALRRDDGAATGREGGGVTTDREREAAEMQVLTADECYRLLATQQVGRLGVNAEHYPLILPVNYALDREVIVMQMAPGLCRAPPHRAQRVIRPVHPDGDRPPADIRAHRAPSARPPPPWRSSGDGR